MTLTLALMLGTATVRAASAPPAGLSKEAVARIDAAFADWSGKDRPGCAVGVARGGELVFARGYGMADLEQGIPIDAQSVFDIGSVSKQFTAASIALLSIDGKLSLDDDVRRFVPEVPDYGQKITIRQLLHHRGGLRDYTWLMSIAGDQDADLTSEAEALQMVARQKAPDFAPGSRYEYSNTGYFLLGVVVERAAGMSLAQFAQERLLAPLGMTSTHFHDDHTRIVPHRAQGYDKGKSGWGIEMSDWEQVGDGSIFTTVGDLAKWVGNLETGKVGGPQFVELMADPGEPDDGQGTTYGTAQRHLTWRGRAVRRHSGAWAGYRAHLMFVPQDHLGVAILCNFAEAAGREEKAQEIASAVLGLPAEPPPAVNAAAAPSPAPAATTRSTVSQLEPLTGRYWSDELGASWQLALRGGRLVSIGRDQTPYALQPGDGDFAFEDGSRVRFAAPASSGIVDGFTLVAGKDATSGIAFRRIDPPVRPLRIVNARLVDGTGAPARTGSVRIVGDRITAVGDLPAAAGDDVVDAHGLALAPGFIDTHSHADGELLRLRDALGAVSQGITTVVGGQDGESPLPLADFLAKLETTPAAINLASYSGHGTLRDKVMGKDFTRHATPAEVDAMAKLLDTDMEAGALGLSTGLEYDPGIYSDPGEVLALAKVAAKHGGRYISHVRSEDRHFWEAIDELLTIGREAKMPVQISHVKLAMKSWWGQAPKLLAELDAARAQGVDVTADIYPYTYWHSTLTVLFPSRDFNDLEESKKVLAEIAPPEGLLLGAFAPHPAYANRTVADIAKERGEAPEVTLLALIHDAEAMRARIERHEIPDTEVENVIGTSMTDADVDALLRWPHTNVCTDGQLDGSHPRGFGTYPRILGRLVRERHVLSLEEAVRHMTSLAADHVGIAGRGRIAPGQYADLVLFDPATVIDRSTTTDPHAVAAGIAHVWVNGRTVYLDGKTTGEHPGRVLRRGDQ